jgi:HK97 gp10 family phage protein
MNVNALLVGTLDSLLPTADGVYKGTATEYIVFNYTELPADFADDDAAHYRYLVQVHLYAPLEKNTRTYRREHFEHYLVGDSIKTDSITPLSAKSREALTMANLSTSGLEELIGGFDAIAEIPDEVVLEMLVAEAEVIAPAQEAEARAMLSGKYSTGETAQSISYDKKLKKTSDGRAIYVYPKGTRRHGNKRRAAEVAFVNEFGKQGQPARPFIQTANEKAADRAIDAAARVYDGFLKSKNF